MRKSDVIDRISHRHVRRRIAAELSRSGTEPSEKKASVIYDIIGDIHGHADELVELLDRLGYSEQSGVFRHPSRQVIFCGDFIDRGPQIRDVLAIASSMVRNEAAQTVMGNHEFNAIAFQTPHPEKPGEFLRPHTSKNIRQHQATLDQLSQQEVSEYIAWFQTLPVALDLGTLRIVHACWDESSINFVNDQLDSADPFNSDFMLKATTQGEDLFEHIERVLKGPEVQLPEGTTVHDKDGHVRRRVRIRWFEAPGDRSVGQYSLPLNPC